MFPINLTNVLASLVLSSAVTILEFGEFDILGDPILMQAYLNRFDVTGFF